MEKEKEIDMDESNFYIGAKRLLEFEIVEIIGSVVLLRTVGHDNYITMPKARPQVLRQDS
jgi:hypothetical protein